MISSCKEWRRLYHEGTINQGQIEKLTLEEAASKIGMSRKTLEDYFKQLRDGCRYKFDFAKHKSEKIGVLRNFVKKSSKLEEPPIEPKKPDAQVEKETFHYIELCLRKCSTCGWRIQSNPTSERNLSRLVSADLRSHLILLHTIFDAVLFAINGHGSWNLNALYRRSSQGKYRTEQIQVC